MRDLFDEFMDELRRRQGEPVPDETPAGDRPTVRPAADSDDSEKPRDDEDVAAADGSRDAEPEEEPQPALRRAPRPLPGGRGPGGPRRPRGGPDDGAGPGDRMRQTGRRIGLTALVVAIVLLVPFVGGGLDLWTDAIWYQSVGFDSVFWTRITAQAVLFAVPGLAALLFLLGNTWLAGRVSPPPDPTQPSALQGLMERLSAAGGAFEDRGSLGGAFGGGTGGRPPFGPRPVGRSGPAGPTIELGELPDLTPLWRWLVVGFCIFLAIGLGASLSGRWETILLWRNQTTFAVDPASPVTDPIFHRDIGFFLFQLPFLRLVQSLVNGLLIAALVVSGIRYAIAAARSAFQLTTPIRLHLAVLGGLYLLSVAAGYQLDKFELAYGTQGFAVGVAYTDQAARFVALDVLTAVAALAGALLVGGAFTRLMWPLGLAVGVWMLASVVLGGLYPQFIQKFTVDPNQFGQERPYIANNIQMTRLAFGLDRWTQQDYRGEAQLTQATVDAEAPTFQNARLWDYRPLGATLDQVQTVRQYYDFTDVDVDRYRIGGVTRQVMLSARELAQERSDSSSWVNQRLTYTHGVGLAMVPVNEVTPEGLPRLFIRDLPPVSAPGVPVVSEPRIYFGERRSNYVITGTRQPEFDYPQGAAPDGSDQSARTSWTGNTGIPLNTTLTRLLFAARFRDLNLLISDQITPDSQLLMYRTLQDRLQLIAPFLRYDKDPYLVVGDDGRLVYIQDAYTVSDRFPNAQPFDPATLGGATGLAGDPFTYIRNSVKVVMNAYDGTLTFYAADAVDPILRAYEGIFPDLFHPLDEMPADLRAHLRVPEELFNVETRMYATYHVTDPETFYRRADLWTVPQDSGSEQSLATEAYYVVMRMPGEADSEFLLLQPMVPQQRPNMISWVAARSDGQHYGEVVVYRFPQDTSVLGPNQIEAQIDADPTISAQVSLWNQSGSKVIRGNLIVVPVQDTLIYLQPLYLQSTTSAFPTFQKIVVASPTKIVWGNTLADALRLLLSGGGGSGPGPGPTPSPGPGGSPGPSPSASPGGGPIATPSAGDVAALVAYANQHFEAAQAALRAGDFARYGQEIAAVQDALGRLNQLVGSPGPSPTP